MPQPAIVVHGGAGRSVEDEAPYKAALEESLRAGAAALTAGTGAVVAALAAVELLEDSTLFNAGRGSVLTSEGRVEMDAAIMCGRTRRAGAVATVTGVRHPIALAHAVMEHTPHVLLAGACDAVLGSVEGAGLIAVDARGNVAMPFNTPAMHRGRLVDGGRIETAVGRS